jgi:fermentation-respiration switch protein FrsA (DUF1100 family)
MQSPLAIILLLLVLAYAAVMLGVWRFQERVVFQPPARGQGPVGSPVRYKSRDGTELWGWMVGARTPAARVMLAFHGNAELARWAIPWAEEVVRRTAVCVMLAEFRGYDGLQGPPTYTGVADDARAARAYLIHTVGVPPAAVTYYGFSLGTAVATELASDFCPRGLILQAPFTSARDMARRMKVPGIALLWRIVSRVHYDTISRVRTLGCAVSVAHGDRDMVIPCWMGRAVHAAAAKKGELLIVHGAGHNQLAELGGESYWAWLEGALADQTNGQWPKANSQLPATND